jgi:hypothetical protein
VARCQVTPCCCCCCHGAMALWPGDVRQTDVVHVLCLLLAVQETVYSPEHLHKVMACSDYVVVR